MQRELSSPPIVRGYDEGGIDLGERHLTRSFAVTCTGAVRDWSAPSFDALRAEDFSALFDLLTADEPPEAVLLGSGRRLRFVPAAWLRRFIDAGIGVETMDTVAACRTWNLLTAEGRRVAAAFLLETAAGVQNDR